MGSWTRRRLAAAGALLALAALTACSGGAAPSDGSGSGSAVGSAAAVAPDGAATAPGVANRLAAGVDRSVVHATAVIKTGEVAITSRHPARVRAEVDTLLKARGGTIDNEQTTNSRDGRIESSTLVLRIPVDQFEAAKRALMGLGRLKTSDESSKDVTTQVIDVGERVTTLQNSIDDLQRFQRAAHDVKDLLDFEEKITARQAELQSLKAQQSYLDDQTSMATLTLYLSTPATYVPPPDALENAGFLSGLRAGWHALGDAVVVVLTVVGATLPFLVLAALLGVPAWFGLRALLRNRRSPAPPTTPAVPGSP
jgi:hypothetical protein